MRKLIFGALVLAFIAAGCATTDYPVITDDRGSFSGVIRTGHKAYQIPSAQVATIWSDGSDDLFSLISQNAFGDQHIYTFNNFDPTASVLFLDQGPGPFGPSVGPSGYCDWRYTGCPITTADNPHNANIDNVFDYALDTSCSGARSLSLLVSYTSRLGECGDAGFWANKQNFMGEFANLSTTTWRGGNAYVVPMNDQNTAVTLNGTSLPIYGQVTGFITDQMQYVVPMTPNMRHELSYVRSWIADNGASASVGITYGALNATFDVHFAPNGINYNLTRF